MVSLQLNINSRLFIYSFINLFNVIDNMHKRVCFDCLLFFTLYMYVYNLFVMLLSALECFHPDFKPVCCHIHLAFSFACMIWQSVSLSRIRRSFKQTMSELKYQLIE